MVDVRREVAKFFNDEAMRQAELAMARGDLSTWWEWQKVALRHGTTTIKRTAWWACNPDEVPAWGKKSCLRPTPLH